MGIIQQVHQHASVRVILQKQGDSELASVEDLLNVNPELKAITGEVRWVTWRKGWFSDEYSGIGDKSAWVIKLDKKKTKCKVGVFDFAEVRQCEFGFETKETVMHFYDGQNSSLSVSIPLNGAEALGDRRQEYRTAILNMANVTSHVARFMREDALHDIQKATVADIPTQERTFESLKAIDCDNIPTVAGQFKKILWKGLKQLLQLYCIHSRLSISDPLFWTVYYVHTELFLLGQLWLKGHLHENLERAAIAPCYSRHLREINLARHFLHELGKGACADYDFPEVHILPNQYKARDWVYTHDLDPVVTALKRQIRSLLYGSLHGQDQFTALCTAMIRAKEWKDIIRVKDYLWDETDGWITRNLGRMLFESVFMFVTPLKVSKEDILNSPDMDVSKAFIGVICLDIIRHDFAKEPESELFTLIHNLMKRLSFHFQEEGIQGLEGMVDSPDMLVKRSALALLGNVHWSCGKYDQAVECFLKSLEIAPNAFVYTAAAMIMCYNPDASARIISRKIKAIPNLVVWNHIKNPVADMIEVLGTAKHRDTAELFLRKALALEPDFELAKQVLKKEFRYSKQVDQ